MFLCVCVCLCACGVFSYLHEFGKCTVAVCCQLIGFPILSVVQSFEQEQMVKKKMSKLFYMFLVLFTCGHNQVHIYMYVHE